MADHLVLNLKVSQFIFFTSTCLVDGRMFGQTSAPEWRVLQPLTVLVAAETEWHRPQGTWEFCCCVPSCPNPVSKHKLLKVTQTPALCLYEARGRCSLSGRMSHFPLLLYLIHWTNSHTLSGRRLHVGNSVWHGDRMAPVCVWRRELNEIVTKTWRWRLRSLQETD